MGTDGQILVRVKRVYFSGNDPLLSIDHVAVANIVGVRQSRRCLVHNVHESFGKGHPRPSGWASTDRQDSGSLAVLWPIGRCFP